MLTIRLAQLGFLISTPLLAAVCPADWTAAKIANEPEALFVRRIADFWEEGEYEIAKNQMEEFLVSFSTSQFADPIRCYLGDLLLREKNYSDALALYTALSSPEFMEKIFLNRMQCLYNLGWYSTLADECEKSLTQSLNEADKLHATFYLAIALYHQCLNAAKDPETLSRLAKKAEPYFTSLLESEFSTEISQVFAHLSCMLKNYQKAAEIYLDLAEKDSLIEDEMRFQAALIQAEYDQDLALHSFEQIAKNGNTRARDAAFNHLILTFDKERYEEIVKEQESILTSIPENRKGMARLYIGQSFHALKRYSEAVSELTAFLEEDAPLESIRTGLISLIEAAHQSGDVPSLNNALVKLAEIDPSDGQIAKGKFLKSLLLKKSGQLEEAREELKALLNSFCDFSDREAVLFEWADLEYQAGAWEVCRSRALAFLKEFPKGELAPFAWRYLVNSSHHLANVSLEAKEQFTKDLEALLLHKALFSAEEVRDWGFYLARSHYNLGRFEEATTILESLLKDQTPFPLKANAHLLLGLCHLDWKGEIAAFCEYAETAIHLNADLMEPNALHAALFNAYLELSEKDPHLLEKSAEHLYAALEAHADISKENLLWLGSWFFSKQDYAHSSKVFSSLLEKEFDETACYKLGKLHSLMGSTDIQISLMEKAIEVYSTHSSNNDWLWEKEIKLLLAEALAITGEKERALTLFEDITNGNPALQSETIAQAYLGKAKILAENLQDQRCDPQNLGTVASLFKNLILQRKLDFEPIHLEAALEYVNLLSQAELTKQLSLLVKIKKDFESREDILSKDYHQARLKYPDKNRIYENYMRFFDAEILMVKSVLSTDMDIQKELQAKSKDLLLQIRSECDHQALLKRVASRLQNTDASIFK